MSEFKREHRYIVLKNADLKCLGFHQATQLMKICDFVEQERINAGKPNLECVVVESDWSIYGRVWDLVEQEATRRMPSESDLTTALRQYKHNNGEGLVFGYDREATDAVFAIQKVAHDTLVEQNAELLEALESVVGCVEKAQFHELLDMAIQVPKEIAAARALIQKHKGE